MQIVPNFCMNFPRKVSRRIIAEIFDNLPCRGKGVPVSFVLFRVYWTLGNCASVEVQLRHPLFKWFNSIPVSCEYNQASENYLKLRNYHFKQKYVPL